MRQEKYVGMDVHQATISVAIVLGFAGQVDHGKYSGDRKRPRSLSSSRGFTEVYR